jgi:N-acetylmuramoyl-L-alanine amidase
VNSLLVSNSNLVGATLHVSLSFGLTAPLFIGDTLMAKIVIDPGHGGTTKTGGSSPNNAKGPTGLLEKNAVLDIGLRAAKLIENAGDIAILTRKTDVNLGLADRAKAAKSVKSPVFVSIHFNGLDGSTQGTETFVHTSHSGASADLCRAVQARLVAATGYRDRNSGHPGGVKRGGFGVISPTSHDKDTAAILVEVAFMDVPAEEKRLKDAAYKDKIAAALVAGIQDYLTARGLEDATGAAEDAFALSGLAPNLPPKTAPVVRGTAGLPADAIAETGHEAADDPIPGAAVEEVVAGQVPALADFQAFVDGLGLRYLSAQELLFMGHSNASGACKGSNGFPPKTLWANIARTAQMLDEIRHRLGYAVFINSAYRNLNYNTCIGGEPASLHMQFNAIDFRGANGNANEWHAVAKAVRASDTRFTGGIGRYNTFVHIDTRGRKADW